MTINKLDNPWNRPFLWTIKYLCLLVITIVGSVTIWFILKDAIQDWKIQCPSPFPPRIHRESIYICFYPNYDFIMSFLGFSIYLIMGVPYSIFCLKRLWGFVFDNSVSTKEEIDIWKMDSYNISDNPNSPDKSVTWNQITDIIVLILAVGIPVFMWAYILYINSTSYV